MPGQVKEFDFKQVTSPLLYILQTIIKMSAEPQKAAEHGGSGTGLIVGATLGAGLGKWVGGKGMGGALTAAAGALVGASLAASASGSAGRDLDHARAFLIRERELLYMADHQTELLFKEVSSRRPVDQDLSIELNEASSELGKLIRTVDRILEQCLKLNPGVPKFVDENRQLIAGKTVSVVTRIDRISDELGL